MKSICISCRNGQQPVLRVFGFQQCQVTGVHSNKTSEFRPGSLEAWPALAFPGGSELPSASLPDSPVPPGLKYRGSEESR